MQSPLSSLQAAIIAAASQIVALAVAFGVINNTEAGLVVSASIAAVNVAFLVVNAVEQHAAAKVKVARLAAGLPEAGVTVK